MSWLSKVSDLAGKAEDLLNKFDQTAGDAIQQQRLKKTASSTSVSKPHRTPFVANEEAESYTEEIGRSGLSMPSRVHSEFAAGVPAGRMKTRESRPLPSTSAHDDLLISMLNDEALNPIVTESNARSRRSSGRSVVSVQTTHSISSAQQAEDPPVAVKSQLWAKDSQIAVMRTKISELERQLQKQCDETSELKSKNEQLKGLGVDVNTDAVEELKLSRKNIEEQKKIVDEECNRMKKKCFALEEEVRAMADQLRLAKFNLNENKKEFDEYKVKAQKILQAKEKLVESLKSEGDGAERPGQLLQAELEEMRVERDMARSDLESSQLSVYQLKSDLDELENQLRQRNADIAQQKRTYMEEKQTWQATINLLTEKADCARLECEFVKQEMKRLGDEHGKQIEAKETELRRMVDDGRQRRREDEFRNGEGFSAAEKLVQKQVELEEALRHNHALSLRLERLQRSTRETAVNVEQVPNSLVVRHATARRAIGFIDTMTFRCMALLRNSPTARLCVVAYFVLLHLYVFFIVMSYSPTLRDDTPPAPSLERFARSATSP